MGRTTAAGLLIALAALGCSADPFTDVSGTVTLDGQPLPEGEVIFLSPDQSATPSAGQVVEGRFRCRATYGPKKVQINAVRDTGKREMDGWPIRVSIVPERYNTRTELTVEVSSEKANEFEFALSSKR